MQSPLGCEGIGVVRAILVAADQVDDLGPALVLNICPKGAGGSLAHS